MDGGREQKRPRFVSEGQGTGVAYQRLTKMAVHAQRFPPSLRRLSAACRAQVRRVLIPVSGAHLGASCEPRPHWQEAARNHRWNEHASA
eukprot:1714942-Rhodomonas_salina.1